MDAKSIQSCRTFCDPMDCSLPGSSAHGILQAKMLEWVAISFSRGSFYPSNRTHVSCIAGRFFTDWTRREALKVIIVQLCLILWPYGLCNMEFSRPVCWSGSPFLSPGDLPNPGIKPRFPSLQADSLPAESPGKPKWSLSRLRIFPTQESNQGLLHCRWILYQLS